MVDKNSTVKIKTKNHKNLFYYINILLIAYPVFYPARDLLGHLGQYGLFGIWIIIAIYKKPNFLVTIVKNTYFYIFFIIIIIIRVVSVTSMVPYSFFSPHRLISQFSLMLVYYIFGLWHQSYSSDSLKRSLLKSFFISFFISTLISLYYLMGNQYAIRQSFNYSYFAIGDFNLVYTAVCIVSMLIFLIFEKQVNSKIAILLIFGFALILNASYMTAIILLIFLIWISIFVKYRKKPYIFSFLLIVFLALLLIGIDIVANIIYFIASIDLFTPAINLRLYDIYYVLTGMGLTEASSIFARFELGSISWNSFLDYPFIGIPYSQYGQMSVGSHTQWIDNLARFGILGNLVLYTHLVCWYIQGLRDSNEGTSRGAHIIAWAVFLLLGIVNNNMLGGLFICMFFVGRNMHLLVESKDSRRINIE